MESILVNTRTLSAPTTGVQRYVHEMIKRLDFVVPLSPGTKAHGMGGHAWEQLVLPFRTGRNLLWSPANSGPLTVERQVVTIHDLATMDHPEWFSPSFAFWYRMIIPRLLRRVSAVIAVSEFTGERLRAMIPSGGPPIHVIANGVDPIFYERNQEEIRAATRSLGIDSHPYLLSLSSIEPRKNLARVMAAWRIAQTHIPDVTLVVAGGTGASAIFRASGELPIPPRTLFVGRVEDRMLPALYSGAIALVYPSLYEGFGLPPLEAMACGTPVIASNSTAIPEVVGEAGILVDPMDVDGLAGAMERIVTDVGYCRELGTASSLRARQFSWENAAMKTAAVLRAA